MHNHLSSEQYSELKPGPIDSSSHRALNKMAVGLLNGNLAGGILVLPSREGMYHRIMGLKPGDTVLDPMMGSGTVPVEACLMGIKNDAFHLGVMGTNTTELHEKMIGLRGRTIHQKFDLYIQDMDMEKMDLPVSNFSHISEQPTGWVLF